MGQSTMPALIVRVKTPAVDDPASRFQSQEHFPIEQLVPQLSVERLGATVFPRTAVGNTQRVDASLGQPAAHAVNNALRLVVAADVLGQPADCKQSTQHVDQIGKLEATNNLQIPGIRA